MKINCAKSFFGALGIFAPYSLYEAYRKSGFHPWEIDDRDLIQRWDKYWAPYFQKRIQVVYENRIKEIISVQIQIPIENIYDTSKFQANLGSNSLDIVNLISAINMEYGLNIMGNDILKIETVSELIDYIQKKINEKT
ncbi:phosphopantetheine-binding protein [Candidatus Coxiella mudrowiae]|uniref:phosphopantetheine-binding protein n=1 Tax=Candidatus Coxiella mudrowiae TaxID=2054173 RepID=UPI0031452A30